MTRENYNKKVLHTVFEFQVPQFANRVAIEQGTRRITYQALNRRANHVARRLRELGIKNDTIVGVAMESSIEYVIAILGIMKAGGMFLPLDLRFPEKRLQTILGKTVPKVIVAQQALHPSLKDTLDSLMTSPCPFIILDPEEDGQEEPHETNLDISVRPDDANYIMYTSGSTGTPKAIVGCHKSLSHFIHWEIKEFDLQRNVKVTQLAPITFDASLRDIFVPLLAGGVLCIPEQNIRENILKLVDWLETSEVTLMHCVPSLFRLITKEMESTDTHHQRLPALKHILMAGDALYHQDVLRWMAMMGERVELANLYGPSETTLIKTCHRIREKPKVSTGIVPIGHPISNTAILIVKEGELCNIGEVGEVLIKTPFQSLGYFNDSELTAQSFIQNPLHQETEDIVYRTGDLGRYLPDRCIEFIGRADAQVKVAGIRVELGEIENAVLSLEGIDQVVVMAHENQEHEKTLVCYFTTSQTIPVEAIRAALRHRLPSYLMPSHFVQQDHFPLNTNGKLDRNALPKPDSLLTKKPHHVPPANEVETQLVQIWKDVLEIPEVGVNSPFFEIGGHSLKAIRIVSGIYRSLQVEVSLKEFFENSTIRKLARLILDSEASIDLEIPEIRKQPHYALSHAQRRLWVINKMQGNTEAYCIPAACEFVGSFDVHAFEQTCHALIQRHDSLRTVFVEIEGEPRQKILDTGNFQMEIYDLSIAVDAEKEFQSLRHNNASFPFDLERGPLLRIAIVKMAENRYRMLFNIHHIISDRWSLNVLVHEMSLLYSQFLQGIQSSLPSLPIQYKDYAAWQNGFLASSKINKHRDYWHQKFSDETPVLDLPKDFSRPPLQTYSGDRVTFTISSSVLGKLRAFSQQRDLSLFISLQSLVKVLLYRYTGQSDIVVGSVIAGRHQEVLESQMGLYMNVLAFRDTLLGHESFETSVQKIRRTAIEAYEHQIYPFDRLVEELNLNRDLGRSPLFDVAMDLQGTDQIELSLAGVSVIPFKGATPISKYDLFFSFVETETELTVGLTYNTDLFRRTRIERMATHFAELLNSVLAEPTRILDDLNILPVAEEAQIRSFNPTPSDYPQDATMVSLFEKQVQETPGHIAIIFGETELTYEELNSRADRVAQFLREQKHVEGPEQRVALLAEPSEWFVIGLLGILKAGGAYVPIDPTFQDERIGFMLQDSSCHTLLMVTESSVPRFAHWDCQCIPLPSIEASEMNTDSVALTPNQLAYVIYTSGSTGRPKGVLLEHGGFVNMILSQIQIFGLTAEDRVLQFASPSFDASMSEIFMALLSGASLVLIHEDVKRDKAALLQILQNQRVTTATFPPTYLRLLGFSHLKMLKTLITAGESAISDNGEFIDPNHHYWNAYGPTEYSVCASCFEVPADFSDPLIPIGRPIANTEVLILNSHNQQQPLGIPGEICLSGPGIARGYLNQRELTAQKFVDHPFQEGARMYRTGDLGAWRSDGTIEYWGRNDEQLKVNGYRIEPGEVASVLSQQEAIDHVFVSGVKDTADRTALVAYYSLKKPVELWPSVAEFFIYDDVLYRAMATHEERNRLYANAFQKHLPGKIVVEVGPGPEAILSRLAIEAGAEKVYAIEYLKSTYDKACETVRSLGLEDRIHLLHGDAMETELPEKADFCISEIVGNIGGSEGSARIINETRRLLHNPSHMIPQRSVTQIAACSLPDDFEYALPEIAAHYTQKIFEDKGYSFDLRMCLKHFSREWILSNEDIFEDLDYTQPIVLETTHTIRLEMQKDGVFHGFAVWLTLDMDSDNHLDILDSPESWLPVYLPFSVEGITVQAGDWIEGTIVRTLCENRLNPDFCIHGKIHRSQASSLDVEVRSFHDKAVFRHTPFYEQLFSNGEIPIKAVHSTDQVRTYLKQHLPQYMVPQHLVEVERFPLTSSGKINPKALPAPDSVETSTSYVPPTSALQQQLVTLWEEILGRTSIGIYNNFFDLGGNSLHAVQMISRSNAELSLDLTIKALFANPTIAGLSNSSGNEKQPASASKSTLGEVSEENGLWSHLNVERRPFVSLFACHKIPLVDAVALSCFSPRILESLQLDRASFLSQFCNNLPLITKTSNLPLITKTSNLPQGRVAGIHLPIFSDELYGDSEALVELILDGLALAKTIGAKVVSLTGMLPAATDLGRAILAAPSYHDALPRVTTGHAAVISTIVLTLKKLLTKSRRNLTQETVAFLGQGGIGTTSLLLMLEVLPHPKHLMLCGAFNEKESMETLRDHLIQTCQFTGTITVLEMENQVPDKLYEASVIIGTLPGADLLEVPRLKSSALVIGDFPPHCFNTHEAIQRFNQQGDILLSEGDVLSFSQPIESKHYVPHPLNLNEIETKRSEFFQNTITGCVFSSFMPLLDDKLTPTCGLIALEDALQHYWHLHDSGLEAADPHCEDFVLDSHLIERFANQYGETI